MSDWVLSVTAEGLFWLCLNLPVQTGGEDNASRADGQALAPVLVTFQLAHLLQTRSEQWEGGGGYYYIFTRPNSRPHTRPYSRSHIWPFSILNTRTHSRSNTRPYRWFLTRFTADHVPAQKDNFILGLTADHLPDHSADHIADHTADRIPGHSDDFLLGLTVQRSTSTVFLKIIVHFSVGSGKIAKLRHL